MGTNIGLTEFADTSLSPPQPFGGSEEPPVTATNSFRSSIDKRFDTSEGWGFGVFFALWLCFALAFLCSPLLMSEHIRRRLIACIMGRSRRDEESEFLEDPELAARMREERRRFAANGESEVDEATRRKMIMSLLRNFTLELVEKDFKMVQRSQGSIRGAAKLRELCKPASSDDVELALQVSSSHGTHRIYVQLPLPGKSAKQFTRRNQYPPPTEESETSKTISKKAGNDDSVPSKQAETTTARQVASNCAICLDSYEIDDRVAWSSNSTCQHVFHQECVVEWLIAKKKRSRALADEDDDENAGLTCPCCRQSFVDMSHCHVISPSTKEDEEVENSGTARDEPPSATSSNNDENTEGEQHTGSANEDASDVDVRNDQGPDEEQPSVSDGEADVPHPNSQDDSQRESRSEIVNTAPSE